MIYLTHVRLGSILGQKVKMIRHGSVSGDFTAGMRPADEPSKPTNPPKPQRPWLRLDKDFLWQRLD